MTRAPNSEAGSVSLEAVLVLPAVIITLLAVIQVALFAHAGHVVGAAAREGARAARLSGAPDTGQQRATDFLHRVGRQVVLDPQVTTATTGAVVVVKVTGHAATLLPGVDLEVQGQSSGPIERFDNADGAP